MTDNMIYHSESDADLDYIKGVAQIVYSHYNGHGVQWQLADSDQLWKISLGGRAGVLGVRLQGRISCVKLYYDKPIRSKLRTLLGFSKGRRAYRSGIRLRHVGVRCPRMLGYVEKRPMGPAMIVTELIHDGIRLDQWIPQYGMQRDVVLALAHYIQDMHDKGVSHLDLSPRNLLILPCSGDYAFFLLDYEDARFARYIKRRTRLHNLYHLHKRVMTCIPKHDRLRFLDDYSQADYPAWRDALHHMTRCSG